MYVLSPQLAANDALYAAETKLQGATATIAELETKLQGATAKNTELETKLQGATAKITEVETKLQGATTKITELEVKLHGATAKITELGNALGEATRREAGMYSCREWFGYFKILLFMSAHTVCQFMSQFLVQQTYDSWAVLKIVVQKSWCNLKYNCLKNCVVALYVSVFAIQNLSHAPGTCHKFMKGIDYKENREHLHDSAANTNACIELFNTTIWILKTTLKT